MTTRRTFLKAALAGTAGLCTNFWIPRRARAANAPIKRVVIINGHGGIRWSATFDSQTDVTLNPWGNLPWDSTLKLLDPSAPKPDFDVSRLLFQKPLEFDDPRSWDDVLSYLKTNTLSLNRPTLSMSWGGVQLPNYLDIAGNKDVSIVRVSNNPGGDVDTDHGSASHTLATGYPSGLTGVTTAFQRALRDQIGASQYDSSYQLPAVHMGGWGWDLGVGDYAASRPLTLADYTGAPELPNSDPGDSVSKWGRNAEAKLDAAFQTSRAALAAQEVANLVNDKAHEHYVQALIDPALHLTDADSQAATLGAIVKTGAPVSNVMLNELFGLSSDACPAGDILFDVFGSQSGGATWGLNDNGEGLVCSHVVRMLQKGAPIVSVAFSNYDSHSEEVLGMGGGVSAVSRLVALGRALAALTFALKNIADPNDPTMQASLWDSTVIIVNSEFGRSFDSDDGFYAQSDGGGSQHGSWSGWPILGGPVTGGKLFTDGSDGANTHQNCVYTSLLQGLGIEDANNTYLPYAQFPVIDGLIKGV